MNNNPINRFFFQEGCTTRSTNYPGLVDGIYLLFFNDRTSESKMNEILLTLHGFGYSKGLYTEGAWHEGADGRDFKEEDANKYDNMPLYECAHLSWKGYEEWSAETTALRVPINVEKSSFSCKSQGEHKGHTYISELNAVLEERSSQVSELVHALLNTGFKIGVLFRDANGDARIIADPYYNIKIEFTEESGEGPTGTSSASIKFSQVSKVPPIYFRGSMMFGYSYGAGLGANYRLSCTHDGGYSTLEDPAKLK